MTHFDLTGFGPVMRSAAALPFSVSRTARITRAPTRANSRAVTSPSPLLAR
ncbi:dehydrogenase domain protein [Mycobacterium xenopi 3993]|nr:dehydrogenase domain protein [Mycobacterium xenopi 3993]